MRRRCIYSAEGGRIKALYWDGTGYILLYLHDGAEALGRRKSAGRRPMEGRASCGFFWKKWRRGSGADHLHAQAGELGGVFGRDVRCGDDLPDVVDLTELNMGAFFEFRGVGQTVELVRIA